MHHLDALLRTMRAIERAEEQLCSLMHHVQRTGALETEVAEELREALANLPSTTYARERAAALATLSRPKMPVRKASSRKTIAGRATTQGRP